MLANMGAIRDHLTEKSMPGLTMWFSLPSVLLVCRDEPHLVIEIPAVQGGT